MRLLLMALFGVLLGVLGGAACGLHAQSERVVEQAPESSDPLDGLLDCLSWHESRDNPAAYNARSGAAGLFQFLYGTWLSTPAGKAGLSRYDPIAAREAARWMIGQGRLREWSTWRLCA
jgi:hypothetical protein